MNHFQKMYIANNGEPGEANLVCELKKDEEKFIAAPGGLGEIS